MSFPLPPGGGGGGDDLPPDPFEPDGTAHEEIKELVSKLEDATRKIGLYLEDVAVASPDQTTALNALTNKEALTEAVTSGEASLILVGTFAIGDIAFSKRTLDPEQHKVDDEARMLLPKPEDELRDKIKKALEEGKDIFDLGEEDSAD